MKTSRMVSPDRFMNTMLVLLGVGLVMIMIMGAFFFGTVWANGRGSSPLPVVAPATQTPFVPSTDPVVDQPTEMPQPTATLEPTLVPTLTPTSTPEPTATPVPTATPLPTATPTQEPPEEWARFIQDVTIADGTLFAPKKSFEKIWRIKNIGVTTWTKEYDLVYVGGAAMTETKVIPLPWKVVPGDTIDLSVDLVSPKTSGDYEGRWMLRAPDGSRFGVGPGADLPLTVKIKVLNVPVDSEYDFTVNMCRARWWNGEGKALGCPSQESNINGFVTLLYTPYLETKRVDRPALWVRPNNKLEGKIAGMYPPYRVQDGDHFRSTIGCLDNSKGCKLVFKLQYQIAGGDIQTLHSWDETYGGGVTHLDVDLSALAGQDVQFILRAVGYSNLPDKNNGFWLTPHIINTK